jgi:hypothetical protein
MVVGIVGAVVPRRGYGWLRRRIVLTSAGQRVVVDRGRRKGPLPKMLQNGVITRSPASIIAGEPVEIRSDDRVPDGEKVEQDTIEQYIEE